MKAFVSHSSKDKGFVDSMVRSLRPGTYELDSETFDSGILNSQAIMRSLEKCDLFCLILSSQSVKSGYVNFETLLGLEFFASGKISRFLAICIDEHSFNEASESVKYFNVVRKMLTPDAASRLVQGHLISSAKLHSTQDHPFIGREDELRELGKQVNDYRRPPSKALYLSGNFGSGRRTVAQQFYKSHFPHVGQVFPIINVEPFAGLEELYQAVLAALRPTILARDLLSRIQGFKIASRDDKIRLISQQLNAVLHDREAAFVIDKGGVLTDAGSLTPELHDILDYLEASPHPPVTFISSRMIPRRMRRSENDISYLPVTSLKREATEGIISRLARGNEITLSEETLEQLVGLSDSHPFNIYRMIEEITDCGLQAFLANPSNFIDWKHRQSSEYLRKIDFSEIDIFILGVLKMVPELDFSAIVEALDVEEKAASEALLRLVNLHIIESSTDSLLISPPMRIAVERDNRIRLPKKVAQAAIHSLSTSLSLRLDEGTAPVVLINSALLASLQSGVDVPAIVAGFLLPSHYVWMAKKNYDERQWADSIYYANRAMQGRDRLSASGVIGACRFLCLASARVDDQKTFSEGLKVLRSIAKDDWAESNIAFLQGFNFRLKGHIPKAELSLRRAYNLSPGNFSAARELASICLERGNLQEGERFAREAHQHAQSNPYLVDILVAILIRKYKTSKSNDIELAEMFKLLKKVGDEEGRSFYTTRKAEFEYFHGDNGKALNLIEIASSKTPNLFEPRRLHAEILLKMGNKVKANEVISEMKGMVSHQKENERRRNYRQYLQTYAHYLVEVDRYDEAKKIFDDQKFFTVEETEKEIRDIEIVQGYRMKARR